MTIERYEHGIPGWVGRIGRPGTNDRIRVSWWYGPDHGWGTTSGPLEYSTAVFATKAALVEAARKVYGRTWAQTMTPVRVADAEEENFDRWISWWIEQCAKADVKPDNKLPDKTIATRINNRHDTYEGAYSIEAQRARYVYARSKRSDREVPR